MSLWGRVRMSDREAGEVATRGGTRSVARTYRGDRSVTFSGPEPQAASKTTTHIPTTYKRLRTGTVPLSGPG